MTIQHRMVGEVMQAVMCQLGPGQTVYSEAGNFLWKTTNVSMETRLTKGGGDDGAAGGGAAGGGVAGGSAAGGGAAATSGAGSLFKKAVSTATEVGKRTLAGESLAFQWFQATGESGLVSFAGVVPGQMRVLELDGSAGWYAEKDAFVCAEGSVGFDIAFSGFKAGRKGGEGFVLEHLTGSGTAIISGAGTLIDLDLSKYGGKVQIDTGCVVAFQDSVHYGVERVGGISAQTAMTAAFGGEGLHLATLEGDGKAIIQSLTLGGLANALAKWQGRANT